MFIRRASLLLCFFWLPLPALAYIDPGSGSAVMSAVIGALVASWLVIKTYWYKVKSLFSRDATSDNNQPVEEDKANQGHDRVDEK